MRLYLLTLLADQPMHGYELMQAIEQRFNGTYVPSAGTIYPRLAKLTEDGLITKAEAGRRTIYSITDAGREELRKRKDETGQLEEDIDMSARAMADKLRSDVRQAMSSIKDDLDKSDFRSYPRGDAQSSSDRFTGSPFADLREESRSHDDTRQSRWRDENRSADQERARSPRRLLEEAESSLYHFSMQMHDLLRDADMQGRLSESDVRDLSRDLNAIARRLRMP
jgi:DNA-binding PadR family transcriptional regulator